MLPTGLALAIVAVLALASLRWPLVTLAAFVALIPIEEVVVITGFGTISRFAGILFAVTYAAPRIGRLVFGAMPPAAWAFLAWAGLSLGWAVDPNTAWAELPTLFQLFLIAVLVADIVVQRPATVRPLLWAYSLSAAGTAMIGIWSFVALGSSPGARAAALQDQNPAQFAGVLLPALIFGIYEVLGREGAPGRGRLLGGVVALLTTVGVVVSGTRGAWVSVVVVVLLFILPRLELRRLILAIATLLLIGIVTIQLPGVSDMLAQRVGTAVSTGGAGRSDIWTVALTIYKSAPVLGVGYANFSVAYTQDAVRASDVMSWVHLEGYGPHSLAFGTLIELGPIGLVLLALFLAPLILRRGWGPDAMVVQAALASLLILALFLDVFANRKQVWFVIGLSAGLAYLARRKDGTAPAEIDSAITDADAGATWDRSTPVRPDVAGAQGLLE
jgi:O-antigen ligase